MKKALSVAGVLLVTWILIKGNLSYITDWSTSELVGYNVWTVIVIAGAGYIIYRVLKLNKNIQSDTEIRSGM